MVLAASAFSAYSASKDDGTAAKVAEAMNSKTFTINIMTIIPQSGPVEQCSGEYSIRVVDGKADGRLPFRGTSYVAVLGSEDPAIVLDGTPVTIKSKSKKKGTVYTVSFKTEDSNRWEGNIRVQDNGGAVVSCTCMNKSPMNYNGELVFE